MNLVYNIVNMTIKDKLMIVNVAEAKAKLSNLLSLVDLQDSEIIISKRDKPIGVLISYHSFLETKKQLLKSINTEEINALPSGLEKYIGIVNSDEIDKSYKNSRTHYLEEKYL